MKFDKMKASFTLDLQENKNIQTVKKSLGYYCEFFIALIYVFMRLQRERELHTRLAVICD